VPADDPGALHADLRARALAAGVTDAVVVGPSVVVTAEWVRMKCLWGCTPGGCLNCPPHSPTPAQTRRLLDEYDTILLLRFDVDSRQMEWDTSSVWVHDTTLALERELFLQGFYKAFAIAGGRSCALEEDCGRPEICATREGLRPGPVACGIDVFTTSANAGWPLGVVQAPGEPYHRYALVLVK
jgi:predicted metal-binding protein